MKKTTLTTICLLLFGAMALQAQVYSPDFKVEEQIKRKFKYFKVTMKGKTYSIKVVEKTGILFVEKIQTKTGAVYAERIAYIPGIGLAGWSVYEKSRTAPLVHNPSGKPYEKLTLPGNGNESGFIDWIIDENTGIAYRTYKTTHIHGDLAAYTDKVIFRSGVDATGFWADKSLFIQQENDTFNAQYFEGGQKKRSWDNLYNHGQVAPPYVLLKNYIRLGDAVSFTQNNNDGTVTKVTFDNALNLHTESIPFTKAIHAFATASVVGDPDTAGDGTAEFEKGTAADMQELYAEAFIQYVNAALKGHTDAMYSLGGLYCNGKGVEKNHAEGFYWYKKAADIGHIDAMNSVGHQYYEGEGVEKNDAEAMRWFTKAAEQGNISAMFNIGLLHHQGHGVAQSFTEAINWFKKAAEKGDATAMINLGDMYEHGDGVDKNSAEAFKWYTKAADKGWKGKYLSDALARTNPNPVKRVTFDPNAPLKHNATSRRIMQLCDGYSFAEAMRLALNAPQDERGVALVTALLGVRNASSTAATLSAAHQLIIDNMDIFSEAIWAANSNQAGVLASMRRDYEQYIIALKTALGNNSANNRQGSSSWQGFSYTRKVTDRNNRAVEESRRRMEMRRFKQELDNKTKRHY